jgi:SAM-dependent methyltransferase
MSEADVRAFHAAHAGITARVYARGGSYARLAARASGRVLDLGCGDACLGTVGIDVSRDELQRGHGPRVQGRAQVLPFRDGAFDHVVSHLAFMLMDDIARVVAELHRVLVPGGTFHAVLGGGPTGDGDDAFHRFLALAKPRGPRLGDPRAAHEAGWRSLFAGWMLAPWERWAVDLSGPLDEVYAFLASGYQAHDDVRDVLRAQFGERAPCTVALYYATATR